MAHLPLLVSLTTAAAAWAAATAASAAAAVAAATAMACLLASSSCSEADTFPYEVASAFVVVWSLLCLVWWWWWSFSLYDLTKLHLRFSLGGLGVVGVWECEFVFLLRPRRPRNHFEALPILVTGHGEQGQGRRGLGYPFWFWGRICSDREREREMIVLYCILCEDLEMLLFVYKRGNYSLQERIANREEEVNMD